MWKSTGQEIMHWTDKWYMVFLAQSSCTSCAHLSLMLKHMSALLMGSQSHFCSHICFLWTVIIHFYHSKETTIVQDMWNSKECTQWVPHSQSICFTQKNKKKEFSSTFSKKEKKRKIGTHPLRGRSKKREELSTSKEIRNVNNT